MIAVTRNATNATQFCGSAIVRVPTGGRKKKLKHRTATIDAVVASTMPHAVAMQQNRDQIGERDRCRVDVEHRGIQSCDERDCANRGSDTRDHDDVAHLGEATQRKPVGQFLRARPPERMHRSCRVAARLISSQPLTTRRTRFAPESAMCSDWDVPGLVMVPEGLLTS